jgi:RNase P/RNase MRP subunit p29
MKHELIGEKAEIKFNDKTYKGIIVDETKNMLSLKTKKQIKKFIKKTIEIKIKGKKIKGEKITKRPEERIKSC